MTILDTSLKNYWTALRVLRGAKSDEQRRDIARGQLLLTMLTETDPRIKARLQSTIEQEELRRPA